MRRNGFFGAEPAKDLACPVTIARALARAGRQGAVLGPNEVEDEEGDHAIGEEALPHLDHGEREHASRLLFLHAASMGS